MTRITGPYTQRLATYAAELRYEHIPADIVEHVKRITLNQIGASLSGWQVAPGREVVRVLGDLRGAEEATVIGDEVRLPGPNAAAVNATLAWAPMNDDTHVDSLLHSGHHSVHAALAEGEATGAGGRDFVTAVVASSEVGIRIARAVAPAHNPEFSTSALGFWSELRGPFCAAVASAKLLGLDAEGHGHALGIAATSTSGLQALGESSPTSGTVYAWEAGKAVLNGMLAARLAAAGMTDSPTPLEGPLGWVRSYTRGHGRLEWLTEGLGTVFETGRIQLKIRCNSSMVHPIIEALHELVKKHAITADRVERIVVHGQQWLKDYLWRVDVRTYQDAIFSLPYSLAMVILEPGDMTYPDQVVDHLGDPAVASLMSKFVLEVDPAIAFSAEMSGTISIRTTDGRTYGAPSVARVRGAYPACPFRPGELEDKFRRLGQAVLDPRRLDDVVRVVMRLDQLDDLRKLTDLLRVRHDPVAHRDETRPGEIGVRKHAPAAAKT